jgi:hypothetical protein
MYPASFFLFVNFTSDVERVFERVLSSSGNEDDFVDAKASDSNLKEFDQRLEATLDFIQF